MKRTLTLIIVMVLLMSGSVFADLVDQWRFDETDQIDGNSFYPGFPI